MHITDAGKLPWDETGAPGLTRKPLRGDSDSGPQALLLRSAARPGSAISDRRPQYHPVDEEFLCLDGRFTLEGSPWLTPLCYVYYPPRLVHGFGVDVPGGYTIYLRNNGPATVDRVDEPRHPHPYFLEPPTAPEPTIVADCAQQIQEAARQGSTTLITLRENPRDHSGAVLLFLPAGRALCLATDEDADQLEFFLVSGQLQISPDTRLGAEGYARVSGPIQLSTAATEDTVLMLNYRGEPVPRGLIAETDVQLACINRAPWPAPELTG